MNITLFRQAFPEFNSDSLTQSRIPRIRILFKKKDFKYMQKDLDFVLSKLFPIWNHIYTLNQFYWESQYKWKVRKVYIQELENLWLGNIYNHPSLEVNSSDWEFWCYFCILLITYKKLFHLAIIDAWWRTWRGELHGLPHIEMDNFFFTEELNFVVHVNFILLDSIDLDGIDVSSYDKWYLYNLATYFEKMGFTVLIDKIEEFNV
jgi:hypothetical protein